ncbi:MAG: glycosyltransferase, partial [Pseudomonadota bacterium]|nr:glycosyltransferase [Pseudomonadota bacterium]
LIRRLQRRGKIETLPMPVVTSPRRWQKLGVLRTTLINQLV